MKQFELNQHEYVELNKLLKILGWVGTGGEAGHIILNGEVKVNGTVELQKRKKLRTGDQVMFEKYSVEIC